VNDEWLTPPSILRALGPFDLDPWTALPPIAWRGSGMAEDWLDTCLVGDCRETLRTLPDGCVQTVVTSPPYFGLRDYGVPGQIGSEGGVGAYVESLVSVFREVHRVLADDGTLWLNLGDSYAGSWGSQGKRETPGDKRRNSIRNHPKRAKRVPEMRRDGLKPKDLMCVPWRVAMALQQDGVEDPVAVATIERVMREMVAAYEDHHVPDRVLAVLERLRGELAEAKGRSWHLRQDIIWQKPSPMPESVRDRCTRSHEYLFLLSKSPSYHYDVEAIREPAAQPDRVRSDRIGGNKYVEGVKHSDGAVFEGSTTRNRRSVWTIQTRPYPGAHFAVFPRALVEPCVLAGSRPGDVVLDPFLGSGTVAEVAQSLGRHWVGCELNPEYLSLQDDRVRQRGLAL